MKNALALALCALIVSPCIHLAVSARNQALAQEGSTPLKRDQPKSLDDVRKLHQASGESTGTLTGIFVPQVTGFRLEQTADPFEAPGVLDPLPTPDGAKANVVRLREMMKSDDEGSRTKAKERAEDILTTYFLADMKARVAELDAIKKRVAEMEAQLDKRLQAQREIIDLQKKVMQSDASGLEFFGPEESKKEAPKDGIFSEQRPKSPSVR